MKATDNHNQTTKLILEGVTVENLVELMAQRVMEKLKARGKAIEESGLLTVKEVCALLKVSRQTVLAMRKKEKLQVVQIGKSVRFRVEDIEALQKRKQAGW